MKGTIHFCLEEVMIERYGQSVWVKCLQLMGYPEDHSFDVAIRDDIDEKESIQLFVNSASAANVPLSQIFDDFGEHWCCTYAPGLYPVFFQEVSNTKNALLKLDWLHEVVTRKIPNAHPPRFLYTHLDENTVEVEYFSDRGLIDLFISLIKGLNKKFGDHSQIEKLSSRKIKILFNTSETIVIDHSSAKV
uniref:heme NO-binding domain-containing protein n=1 Tax=Fulvivirga sp. TaxID=1931237 RepID=UPI0040491D6B